MGLPDTSKTGFSNWCQKIQTNSHDILVFHIFVLGVVCGNKKKRVVKMNDRFKFRVWCKGLEKYVDTVNLLQTGVLCFVGSSFGFIDDNYIIEQCTGLKDKNGSLIYEGDVIQFTHNRGYFTNKGDIRVIEFSAFRFCGFGWRSRPENNVEFALTESTAKKCVVIGNIHEQAEHKE